MQFLELLSLVLDLSGLLKDLSDVGTSDSESFKLGIIMIGLVKPKKEDI